MPNVTFIRPNDEVIEGEVGTGESVMEAGRTLGVPEMVGECGGSLSCATCHVYVDADWFDRIPAPEEYELELLEGAIDPRPTSRLSCQIILDEQTSGITLRMPVSQA